MQRVPRLVPSKTSFFICDVQERFRDIISNFPTVIRSAKMLVSMIDVLLLLLLTNY